MDKKWNGPPKIFLADNGGEFKLPMKSSVICVKT